MFTLALYGEVPYSFLNGALTKERAANIVSNWRDRAKIPRYHLYAGIKTHLAEGEPPKIILEIPFVKSESERVTRYEYHGKLSLPVTIQEATLALYSEWEIKFYIPNDSAEVQARFLEAQQEWNRLRQALPKRNGILKDWRIRRYFEYAQVQIQV